MHKVYKENPYYGGRVHLPGSKLDISETTEMVFD